MFGLQYPDTLVAIAHLSTTLQHLRRCIEAEAAASQVVALRKEILGPKHSDTIWSMGPLAVAQFDFGRFEEAPKLQSCRLRFWSYIGR